jgi:BCD family chlorophyll transporter-like MFS transporter
MRWRAILQVSLLNIAVGLILVPLESTLNRVMIYELALPATLVSVLVSLRFITAPLRVWFGRISDAHPIAGRNRTWYIALGMAVMAVGLVTSPYAALSIPRVGALGIAASFLTFGLIGLGVSLTTPLYLALVSDLSSDEQRPRIAATMWTLLGLALAASAFAVGFLIEPYTDQKLIIVMAGVAVAGVVLTAVGLIRLEPKGAAPRGGSAKAPSGPQPRVIRDLLVRNREALRFFLYVVLAFVAVETQQVILEPYAARYFGMTPGQTTQLTGFYRVAEIVTLFGGGFLIIRRLGYRATATIGITGACIALVLIIVSAPLKQAGLLIGGVVLFALGVGLLEATNLSLMMTMTDPGNAGLFMGAWGLAQAVGVGSGTIVGGVLRDVGLLVFGGPLAGYYTAFLFEIVALAAAVPVLRRVSVTRFRETITGEDVQLAGVVPQGV